MEGKDYHVGRGGAGNEHVADKNDAKEGGAAKGLADKLKAKVMAVFKK